MEHANQTWVLCIFHQLTWYIGNRTLIPNKAFLILHILVVICISLLCNKTEKYLDEIFCILIENYSFVESLLVKYWFLTNSFSILFFQVLLDYDDLVKIPYYQTLIKQINEDAVRLRYSAIFICFLSYRS